MPIRTSTRSPEPDDVVGRASTLELVGGLVKDTRDLVEAHIGAAKLEIKEELGQVAIAARRAVLSASLIGVACVLGFLAVAEALAFFLLVPVWAGYGIVAGVAALIGIALAKNARRTLGDNDGFPERELSRAAHDLRWAGKRAGAAARAKD